MKKLLVSLATVIPVFSIAAIPTAVTISSADKQQEDKPSEPPVVSLSPDNVGEIFENVLEPIYTTTDEAIEAIRNIEVDEFKVTDVTIKNENLKALTVTTFDVAIQPKEGSEFSNDFDGHTTIELEIGTIPVSTTQYEEELCKLNNREFENQQDAQAAIENITVPEGLTRTITVSEPKTFRETTFTVNLKADYGYEIDGEDTFKVAVKIGEKTEVSTDLYKAELEKLNGNVYKTSEEARSAIEAIEPPKGLNRVVNENLQRIYEPATFRIELTAQEGYEIKGDNTFEVNVNINDENIISEEYIIRKFTKYINQVPKNHFDSEDQTVKAIFYFNEFQFEFEVIKAKAKNPGSLDGLFEIQVQARRGYQLQEGFNGCFDYQIPSIPLKPIPDPNVANPEEVSRLLNDGIADFYLSFSDLEADIREIVDASNCGVQIKNLDFSDIDPTYYITVKVELELLEGYHLPEGQEEFMNITLETRINPNIEEVLE